MIDIRKACPDDSEQLADIGIQAWENAVRRWGEDADTLMDHAYRIYRDFCTDRWQTIIVAQDDEAIVGWGARAKMNDQISDLWVAPRHHGRGVGKRLLAALERSIADAGFTEVGLETHAENLPAIGLYKASGYRVISRSIKHARTLRRDAEILSMCKTLPKATP